MRAVRALSRGPHSTTLAAMRARARFFILSFGLQYPRATTKAWLHATLVHLFVVNFLIAPLKIWFFAVTLPGLIRGKLRRLRHPKPAVGCFPFRTPMRDSAAEYLAARYAHLPTAWFLLRQPGHDAGAADEQQTPLPRARSADVVATARLATGAAPPPSAAPSAPMLNELMHVGAAHRDSGDPGDERSAISGLGRFRARSRRLRRRTCGTALALVALSLVLCMPAALQRVIVEEAIVVLVSFAMFAALRAASIAQLFAAAWDDLAHAYGVAALVASLAAAAATVTAGSIVCARRAHRRAKKTRLGGAHLKPRCAAAMPVLGAGPPHAAAPPTPTPRCSR